VSLKHWHLLTNLHSTKTQKKIIIIRTAVKTSNLNFSVCFRFVVSDLQKLCSVLQNAVVVPVQGEASPFILPSLNDVVLTQLQDGVLHSMDLLQKAR
jgi:hypothetical protein